MKAHTRFLLTLLLLAVPVGASDGEVLKHEGRTQLSSAIAGSDGGLLTAWKSVDSDMSEVRVLKAGEVVESWRFPGLRVQQARWVLPGKKLLIAAVDSATPVHRLYVVEPSGELRLEWSDEEIRDHYQVVTVNEDGTLWAGSSFEPDRALVDLGRIGQESPIHRWQVDAGAGPPPSALELEQFSQAFFRSGTQEPMDVVIMWGARLWLASPSAPTPRRLAIDCPAVYAAVSTTAGLWVECYRGPDAEPSRLYSLYVEAAGAGSLPERALSLELNDPVFLPNGKVIERFVKEGRATVHETRPGEGRLATLGTFEFPARARLLFGGEAVLVETPAGEEYEVRRITELTSPGP